MKKRIYPVLFALALALSGCGAKSAEDGVYTIGICQLAQHEALDLATQGFMDALEEALPARWSLTWKTPPMSFPPAPAL